MLSSQANSTLNRVALLLVCVSSASAFAAGAPTLTSVSPFTGSTAGGLTVTLTGTNFNSPNVTSVTFGGTPATALTIISSTSMTVAIPAHASGIVSVILTNGSGSNGPNAAFTYDIVNTQVQVTVRVTIPNRADIQWGNGTSVDDLGINHTLPADRISAYSWTVQDADQGANLSPSLIYLTNDSANGTKTINISNVSLTNDSVTLTAMATNTAAWQLSPAAGVNAFRMRAKLGGAGFVTLTHTSTTLTAALIPGTDQALILELSTPTQGVAVLQQTTVQLTAVPN